MSDEKEITDKFYADYSAFKRELFDDLVANNPGTDKLLLFKKTQKLLDRILFILFAEDRGLLPANSSLGILHDWKNLRKMGYGQPLYEFFKNFFRRIDTGYVNEDDHTKDVFAYNGGLFKADDLLDGIQAGDEVLESHTSRLAGYDFASTISVDILGRIFENSLTEIEEVQESLANGDTAHGAKRRRLRRPPALPNWTRGSRATASGSCRSGFPPQRRTASFPPWRATSSAATCSSQTRPPRETRHSAGRRSSRRPSRRAALTS